MATDMVPVQEDSNINPNFLCSFCEKPYKGRDPRVLSCKHAFCLSCLKELVSTFSGRKKTKRASSDSDSDKEARSSRVLVRCPTCRKVSNVPKQGALGFPTKDMSDFVQSGRLAALFDGEDIRQAKCSLCHGDLLSSNQYVMTTGRHSICAFCQDSSGPDAFRIVQFEDKLLEKAVVQYTTVKAARRQLVGEKTWLREYSSLVLLSMEQRRADAEMKLLECFRQCFRRLQYAVSLSQLYLEQELSSAKRHEAKLWDLLASLDGDQKTSIQKKQKKKAKKQLEELINGKQTEVFKTYLSKSRQASDFYTYIHSSREGLFSLIPKYLAGFELGKSLLAELEKQSPQSSEGEDTTQPPQTDAPQASNATERDTDTQPSNTDRPLASDATEMETERKSSQRAISFKTFEEAIVYGNLRHEPVGENLYDTRRGPHYTHPLSRHSVTCVLDDMFPYMPDEPPKPNRRAMRACPDDNVRVQMTILPVNFASTSPSQQNMSENAPQGHSQAYSVVADSPQSYSNYELTASLALEMLSKNKGTSSVTELQTKDSEESVTASMNPSLQEKPDSKAADQVCTAKSETLNSERSLPKKHRSKFAGRVSGKQSREKDLELMFLEKANAAAIPGEADAAVIPFKTATGALPKERAGGARPKERVRIGTTKRTDARTTSSKSATSAKPQETDTAAMPKETDASVIPKGTAAVAQPKEPAAAVTTEKVGAADIPKKTDEPVIAEKKNAAVVAEKIDAAVIVEKIDADVTIQKTDAVVKSDAAAIPEKTDAAVIPGKTDAPIIPGKTDASALEAETDAAAIPEDLSDKKEESGTTPSHGLSENTEETKTVDSSVPEASAAGQIFSEINPSSPVPPSTVLGGGQYGALRVKDPSAQQNDKQQRADTSEQQVRSENREIIEAATQQAPSENTEPPSAQRISSEKTETSHSSGEEIRLVNPDELGAAADQAFLENRDPFETSESKQQAETSKTKQPTKTPKTKDLPGTIKTKDLLETCETKEQPEPSQNQYLSETSETKDIQETSENRNLPNTSETKNLPETFEKEQPKASENTEKSEPFARTTENNSSSVLEPTPKPADLPSSPFQRVSEDKHMPDSSKPVPSDCSSAVPEQNRSATVSPESSEPESIDSGHGSGDQNAENKDKLQNKQQTESSDGKRKSKEPTVLAESKRKSKQEIESSGGSRCLSGNDFSLRTPSGAKFYGKDVYGLIEKTEEHLTIMRDVVQKLSRDINMAKDYEREIEDSILQLKNDVDSELVSAFQSKCYQPWEKASHAAIVMIEEEMAGVEKADTKLTMFFMQDIEGEENMLLSASQMLLNEADFRRIQGYLNKGGQRLPSDYFTYSPNKQAKKQLYAQIPKYAGKIVLGVELLGKAMLNTSEEQNAEQSSDTDEYPLEETSQTDLEPERTEQIGEREQDAATREKPFVDSLKDLVGEKGGDVRDVRYPRSQMSECSLELQGVSDALAITWLSSENEQHSGGKDLPKKDENRSDKPGDWDASSFKLDAQQNALFQELLALVKSRDAVMDQVKTMQTDSSSLCEQVASVTSIATDISQNMAAVDSKLRSLQESVNAMQNKQGKLNQEVSAVKGDKDKVHRDIAAIQKESSALREKVAVLQTNANTLLKDMTEVKKTDKNRDKILTKLETELSKVSENMEAAKKDHIRVLQDIAVVQADVGRLQNGKKEAQREMINLQEGVGAVRIDNTTLQENMKQLREEFNKMQQKLETLRTEKTKKGSSEDAKLREGLQTAQADITKLQKALASVREDNTKLRQDMSSARQRERETKNESCSCDLTSVKTDMIKLQEELTKLQFSFGRFQAENKNRASETSKLKKESDSLGGNLKKLHDELGSLHNDYVCLRDTIEAQKVVTELPERFAALQAENDRLSEEIRSLRIQTQNIASLESEQAACRNSLMALKAESEATFSRFYAEMLERLQKPDTLSPREAETRTEIECLKRDKYVLSRDVMELQRNTWQVNSYLQWLESDLRNFIVRAHVHSGNVGSPEEQMNAQAEADKRTTTVSTAAVAFHAQLDSDIRAASPRILILGNVFTNLGEAYDPDTGIFTAPVPGVYAFMATCSPMKHRGDAAKLHLMRNGEEIGYICCMESSAKDSTQCLVHVAEGEEVYLETPHNDFGSYRHAATTFTGFLICDESFAFLENEHLA